MKKDKLTKKDLKEDEFLEAVVSSTSFLQSHLQQILAVVVVLVLVGGGVTLYNHLGKKNESEASILSGQARAAYQANNYDEALKHFTTLVDKFGSTSSGDEAVMYIANIHFQKEQYDLALEQYKKCMHESAKGGILYNGAQEGIAACYEGLQKYVEAAKEYESIAKNNMTNKTLAARNLFAAARAYEAANDLESAKKLCTEIVDKFKDTKEKPLAENKIVSLSLIAQK